MTATKKKPRKSAPQTTRKRAKPAAATRARPRAGKVRPVAVVKVGGDILTHAAQAAGLGANVRALTHAGYDVVVLHGGGPQATALSEKLGACVQKVAGQRVTSPSDLVVVTQAVCGEVNTQLVALLLGAGVRAFGLHGASGALIEATKRPPVVVDGARVDYGEVGDIAAVDEPLLRGVLGLGVVPVIATLGVDSVHGRLFNINADTVASEIARALAARVVLLVTAVGGVYADIHKPSTRMARLNHASCAMYMREGVISGGMIPKVEEALALVDAGVDVVAIVDAAVPDAFVAAAKKSGTSGTVFTA